MLTVLIAFTVPRFLDVFVPPGREEDGVKNLGAGIVEGNLEGVRQVESADETVKGKG